MSGRSAKALLARGLSPSTYPCRPPQGEHGSRGRLVRRGRPTAEREQSGLGARLISPAAGRLCGIHGLVRAVDKLIAGVVLPSQVAMPAGPGLIRRGRRRRSRRATSSAAAAAQSGSRTRNSSPPRRARKSGCLSAPPRRVRAALDQAVTLLMPARVVDVLEPVEIDRRDAQWLLRTSGTAQFPLEAVVPCPAVGQPRELIAHRRRLEIGDQPFAFVLEL